MKKQKNMFQMKEQDKTTGKENLNEGEISDLLGKKLKVLVIKISPNWGVEWINTMRISVKRWRIEENTK